MYEKARSVRPMTSTWAERAVSSGAARSAEAGLHLGCVAVRPLAEVLGVFDRLRRHLGG